MKIYINIQILACSEYLDGFGQVEEYALRAKEINQQYLCISDHGMMAAVPRQIRACDAVGLKPIFGVELYVNDKHHLKEHLSELTDDERKEVRKSYHLLAIAYNNEGYKNLVQLTSLGFLEGFYYKPRVTHEQLIKHKEGIIFTSCCYNGEIGQAFNRGGEEAAYDKLEYYLNMFGMDNFYLELMLLDFNKQKPYDAWLIKAHDKYHIPLIVSNDCFVENTIISTNIGSKFIQDVNVGDLVITDKGNLKEVEFVNKRQLKEEEKVFKVSTSMGTYAFNVTGNHQVKVANISNIKWNIQRKKIDGFSWNKVENLKTGDYLVLPKIKKDVVFSIKSPKYIDLLCYLNNNDFVTTIIGFKGNENHNNKLFYDVKNECFVSYRGFNFKGKICIPRYLEITKDLLQIFGLYLAKGGLDKNGITISFGLHKKEQNEEHLVCRFFSQFNLNIYKTSKGNGVKLAFSSVVFRIFFEKFLGIGCLNKSMTNIIGKFSEEDVITILSQYFKGDGCFPAKDNYPASVHSTSKKMIFDVSYILNSLGFCVLPCVNIHSNCKHKNPNANVSNWHDIYYLNFGGTQKTRIKNILFNINENIKPIKINRGKRYIDYEDCFAVKITDISELKYDKLVYNLQIKDDETYLANFYSVHNCHYCNPGDSKYQRIMLMIQTKRTEKEILDAKNADEQVDFFELQDTNLWLKSEDELNQKWLSDYSEIIPLELFEQAKKNTVEICKRVNVEVDRSAKLPNILDAEQKFKEACIRGFKWRGLQFKKDYEKRLKMEFDLICRKGFASYFMIQQDIIKEARRICPELIGWGSGDEALGPGRGCNKFDTKIMLQNGLVSNIIDVKVGDFVLTRDGTFRSVVATHEYNNKDEMFCIKSYYGDNEGVTLTGDHKVLVERSLRPDNYEKWAKSTKKARCAWMPVKGELEWIRTDEIKVGDWVLIPYIKEEKNSCYSCDMSVFADNENMSFDEKFVYQKMADGRIKSMQRFFDFDFDFVKFLGLFAADGYFQSAAKSVVCVCFHSELDQENKDLVKRVANKLGLIFKEYKLINKKCVVYTFRNLFFAKVMYSLFDEYKNTSQTKHIPKIIFNMHFQYRREFVRGFLLGDGHCGKNKVTFTTVSKTLAYQLRYLILTLSVPCSVNFNLHTEKRENRTETKQYVLNVPYCYEITDSRQQKCDFYRFCSEGIMTKIRSIEKVPAEEKVYDLTIEGNSNYLTTSFLIHNSCVSSLVCYVLGITDVDPIKHDLLFDRFLSESRGGRNMKMRFKDIPLPE